MTRAVATIAESEVRSRGSFGSGGASSSEPIVTAERLERPEAGESHAEERAPPLRQQRLDELDVPSLERVADLGGDVARLAERRDELGVEGLAARRRVDADGELGSRVEAVLELGQLVEESLRDAFGGGLRDPLEPCERGAYSLPQVGNGFRVTPRLVPSNRPLHPTRIIFGPGRRRPAVGSVARRSRHRGRMEAASARPRRPVPGAASEASRA